MGCAVRSFTRKVRRYNHNREGVVLKLYRFIEMGRNWLLCDIANQGIIHSHIALSSTKICSTSAPSPWRFVQWTVTNFLFSWNVLQVKLEITWSLSFSISSSNVHKPVVSSTKTAMPHRNFQALFSEQTRIQLYRSYHSTAIHFRFFLYLIVGISSNFEISFRKALQSLWLTINVFIETTYFIRQYSI